MTYKCKVTGKKKLVGHKVSHSKIKTKMTQKPNLRTKLIFDPVTGKKVRLKVSTKAIRMLDRVSNVGKFLKERNIKLK